MEIRVATRGGSAARGARSRTGLLGGSGLSRPASAGALVTVSVCESTERRLCTKENPRPMAWSKRTGPAALAVIDRSQIKEHFKVRVRVMVHGHGFGRKSKLEPEVPPGIPLSSSSKLSELFVSTCDHWSTRTLTRLQALHAALN